MKALVSLALFFQFLNLGFAQNLNKELKGTKPIEPKIKPKDINDCPVKVSIKMDGYEVVNSDFVPSAKANLVRSSTTIKFDMVNLDDIKLNIPAFKQFKNNKTDFTENGEKEFREIVQKTKLFIDTDNQGKAITLKITGSASQIPTSFDPSKPNNNLQPDGGSIAGKTSIENNKQLAKARADELAKKLKHMFPSITVTSPTLQEIRLGEQKWTTENQKMLNKAVAKKDRVGIDAIFEPFQKDQWVMVQSTDRTTKKIQPEALKMYMVSTSPSLTAKIENKTQVVKTIFIVSKNTYDKAGFSKTYGTVAERDRFLKKMNLKIYNWDKDSVQRWYLITPAEAKAFSLLEYKERVIRMYSEGIADQLDEPILKAHIMAEIADKYR